MTQAKWNSSVTAPKSANLKYEIVTRCNQLNINVDSITSEDLYGDFLDRMIGNKKEIILFNLSGTVENLTILQNGLLKLEDQ